MVVRKQRLTHTEHAQLIFYKVQKKNQNKHFINVVFLASQNHPPGMNFNTRSPLVTKILFNSKVLTILVQKNKQYVIKKSNIINIC